MKKTQSWSAPLTTIKNNPRTTIGIIIIIGIACFMLEAQRPSDYNIVVASLIALIAAMMAHHSATASSTDKIKKDASDEKNLKRSVIIRAKVLSAELNDLAGQKLIDLEEKISLANETQKKTDLALVTLPLLELYRCRLSLPPDFNFIRENISLIPSTEAINCIARLSFIIGILNSHIESEKDAMNDYIGYMTCADKIANTAKEELKINTLSTISNTLFIQHTNRISSILTELKNSSKQLKDILLKIDENA